MHGGNWVEQVGKGFITNASSLADLQADQLVCQALS